MASKRPFFGADFPILLSYGWILALQTIRFFLRAKFLISRHPTHSWIWFSSDWPWTVFGSFLSVWSLCTGHGLWIKLLHNFWKIATKICYERWLYAIFPSQIKSSFVLIIKLLWSRPQLKVPKARVRWCNTCRQKETQFQRWKDSHLLWELSTN